MHPYVVVHILNNVLVIIIMIISKYTFIYWDYEFTHLSGLFPWTMRKEIAPIVYQKRTNVMFFQNEIKTINFWNQPQDCVTWSVWVTGINKNVTLYLLYNVVWMIITELGKLG